jgi:hypothetical protein
MSYGLQVYVADALDISGLRSLVGSIAGLDVDGDGDARSLTVVRGARRRYSFTVDGPGRVEAEDVPVDVTGAVLGVRYLYSVLVEGSAASEIPFAVRFARQLARLVDGVVLDPQTDHVWSRSTSRTVARPARQARVATVDLTWCCLRDQVPDDAAAVLIAAAERHLPEALPRRFGEYEPFQGRYAQVGRAGFCDAWQDATTPLFFSGTGLCLGGHLAARHGCQFSNRFWSMSLSVLAEPLAEPRWRDAVRALFTTLAERLGAFYASAEVVRNQVWSGRSVFIDGKAERPLRTLRARDGWMGLPPIPVWWSWLGAPYASEAALLPAARCTSTGNGVLFESSDTPVSRDASEPLSTWLPASLFARLVPTDRWIQPVALDRAQAVPDELV